MLVICSLAGCGKTEPPLPALHGVKGKEVDSTGQFEHVTIHQGKRIAGVPEGKYRVVYTPATFVFGENVKVVTLSEIHDIRGPQNALTLDLSKSQ